MVETSGINRPGRADDANGMKGIKGIKGTDRTSDTGGTKGPVRVLHVLGGLSLGGAESRIMDLYRCIDREKVQFDFLVHQKPGTERGDGKSMAESGMKRIPEFYDGEIKSLGGKIYLLPKFKVYNYISYKKAVREFFKLHHGYAVVQGHMTSTASIYLPEAGRAGIPVLCAHARSAGVDKGPKGLVTRLLRLPLLKRADYCFACSGEAGRAVFGAEWSSSPKAHLIPNAIDAEKFRYNETVRNRLRRELKIENCYVIGHVGRFHYAKNHEFLLEIFERLHRSLSVKGKRCVLMLLGEGDGMKDAKAQAGELGIAGDVLFMGNKKDVEAYYQVFDFFLFPSRFEGLPGTVVEAQAAGLRCLISDRITKEVGLSGLVRFEDIDKSADVWAEYVEEHLEYEREDMSGCIKASGFDVKEQAVKLEEFYLSGVL